MCKYIIFGPFFKKKCAVWVIHYAHEQLLTPTLPLQTHNEAGGLLRPKIKDKMSMSLSNLSQPLYNYPS